MLYIQNVPKHRHGRLGVDKRRSLTATRSLSFLLILNPILTMAQDLSANVDTDETTTDEAENEGGRRTYSDGKTTVSASITQGKGADRKVIGTVSAELQVGETLSDLIDLWGEDHVRTLAISAGIVKLQGQMRSRVASGVSIDTASKEFQNWNPGVSFRSAPQDPVEAARSAFSRMSPEEREAFLQGLSG